jgi:GDPmannose 4,6-dehydratase
MGKHTAPRRALICGVSGQDGAYLAQLLLDKGYQVSGTSRDAQISPFSGLSRLGIRDRVETLSMSPTDFRSVLQVVSHVRPHEIYNLAGQSSVGLSFDQPVDTMESISVGALNLLEVIRFVDPAIRLYNAGSCEIFGDTGCQPADESTPFRPRSPYAVARAAATWQVAVYRESYGLFACTGILSNHESPLRPERFVTRKIVSAACRIANGSNVKLKLGNINIQRDWGWAPEYVVAMWRMLNHAVPEDFVIATGVTIGLRDFVIAAFSELDLDWEKHVKHDETLVRKSEVMLSMAKPEKAFRLLGWKAECTAKDVARRLVLSEIESSRSAVVS